MATRKILLFILAFLGIVSIAFSAWFAIHTFSSANPFNGQRAYQDVAAQVGFGSRTPGSTAHSEVINYIQQELEKADWKVQVQTTDWLGFSIQNIIATYSDAAPRIIVGAHYDSRLFADQDTGTRRTQPVPGANDGASGVPFSLNLRGLYPRTASRSNWFFLTQKIMVAWIIVSGSWGRKLLCNL